MANNYLTTDTELGLVAAAIRTKGGTTGQLEFPTGFVQAINAIDSGGSGITEYESGTWTPTSNIARGTINFSNSHSAPPSIVFLSDVTNDTNTTSNTNFVFIYLDAYRTFGSILPYSSTAKRYSVASYIYRASSTTSLSNGNVLTSYSSNDTSATNYNYSRYWATNTGFHPYTNSTSRYWRSGRMYKWYAIWLPDARPNV